MIDYDRYDHTYCRVLKDGEDLIKPFSVASAHPISECEFSDHHVEISTESENGSTQPEREPMIIVRTKRARKPTPIVVKAFNVKATTKDGIEISTVVQANNASRILPNNKIVNNNVKQASDKSAPTISVEKDANKIEVKGIVNKTKDDMSGNVEDNDTRECDPEPEKVVVEEEQPQLTKSGRLRKLTAKAKQNTEESKKKMKQLEKLNENGDRKKRRGRPVGKRSSTEPSPGSDEKSRSRKQKKTNPVANESEAAAIVHSKDSTGSQEIEDESAETGNKAAGLSELPLLDNEKEATEDMKAEKKTTRPKKSANTPSTSSIKKSQRSTTNQPATATKRRHSNKSASQSAKSSGKRTPGKPAPARTRLVVVTKPPPKRRAQEKALNASNNDSTPSKRRKADSIPAAKIDLNNIVRGSRRRR